ncbi:BZ3500_MvSof-1268-A1-R1_Chr5-1g07574 [Microbotryum saponariae]|uniref:BZ3500_MvSof-1268-A1-R1_Chr5-1g07574 protein n=1 Tax=Microbotryum saponariae TaxID=289078 RepID=A0A2X0M8G5_9BASI|nr:BZ3500_MvSof-1268-A1-R1_Chr5-1g07574 [Microbotryum saponariae]SDA05445.1 BZ3501_MvSof-1269-A2-R1_Chr5-2g07398 [Microbotryum saponariae]
MSATSLNPPMRHLFSCTPHTWFEPPPPGDAPDYSIAPRLQANAGTAFHCAARLGGLKWGKHSSPGDRVIDSFFDLLDLHPSLLELFEAKIEAMGSTRARRRARITEDEVQRAFTSIFAGGLEDATCDLLDHYASITEDNFTPTTSGYWVKLRSDQGLPCRTRGDAILEIGRGIDDSAVVVSSIAIDFERGPVHHTAAKGPPPSGSNSAIPVLDHSPVPLQNLETQVSVGPDAIATKVRNATCSFAFESALQLRSDLTLFACFLQAIIQCASQGCRFFLLFSVPFFQIGELVEHQTADAARASDAAASTALASTSTAPMPGTSIPSTPTPPFTMDASAPPTVRRQYSLLLQELARWVELHPGTSLRPAETLGVDVPTRSFIVSFIALAFTAVMTVPDPEKASVKELLDANPNTSTQSRPRADSDSDVADRSYEPAYKVQKISAIGTGTRSSRRMEGDSPLTQAKDPNRPTTLPVSEQAGSDLSSGALTPVDRSFSSPRALMTRLTSPISGSHPSSRSVTIVQDREFVIKASSSNAHWSMMSYTGTSRVNLVEIDFDIVSSVPSDLSLPSHLSSNPSPATDFIRSLHLSDAVLRWLTEDPKDELEDDRIPLELFDHFETTADLRLEKQVGTGSTADGYLANVVRVNPRWSSPADREVGHPAPNTRYFLKLVTCHYVGSVVRETLFYQHVFPHLPNQLQNHLPRYHGTYRGINGNGYAMVLEDVGTHMNYSEFYERSGQWHEIEKAFVELGIVHNDIRQGNVLVRPDDGGFCFVDWGRSYLKLRV